MKKVLRIVVLGLLMCSNTYAENVFNCEIIGKTSFDTPVYAKIIIKVNDNSSTKLGINKLESELYKNKNLLLVKEGYMGNIIIIDSTDFIPDGNYDLFVSFNSKKNDTMYFRGFFSQDSINGLVHTLTINVWEKNMPLYFFISNQPEEIFKGNCI